MTVQSVVRKFVGAGTLLAATIALSTASFAAWPDRSITFVVPYAPGGQTDSIARIVGRYVSKELGQTVIIENKPGAGGILGSDIVAKAKPDGYTFCVCGSGAISIAPFAQKGVSYKPLESFDYVGIVNTNPQIVLVNAKLPIDSVPALIEYAKKNPGKLNYGSSGVGGLMHFSVALFQSRTGTKMTHVPYGGGAPATRAVLAGEVDLVFTNANDAVPLLDSKDVRILAVTSPERVSFAPKVPTVAEVVPGYDVTVWNGLLAPKGTPQEAIDKLSAVLLKMSKDPEIKTSMEKIGAFTDPRIKQQYYDYIKGEVAQWEGLLKEIGYSKP